MQSVLPGYQQGFSEGFTKGLNEMWNRYQNIFHTLSKPPSINIPYESIPEDLKIEIQKSMAEVIISEIEEDICDRHTLKHIWRDIDDETKKEIRSKWLGILTKSRHNKQED